jgi:hypothetical protein
MLSSYDFKIHYRSRKTNPTNGPSRRLDYVLGRDIENIILPTLRNKLRAMYKKGLLKQLGITYDLLEVSLEIARVLKALSKREPISESNTTNSAYTKNGLETYIGRLITS